MSEELVRDEIVLPAEPVPDGPVTVSPVEALLDWLAAHAVSIEEAVGWGLLAALALVSRLLFLGSPPLNLEEGRRALEAYTLLQSGRVTYEGAPILSNLISLTFTLFTAGDLQARLAPAVCGVLLVLTPLLLRPVLGGWWSLSAGICLASSTILLSASRSVSPAVPAMLCVAVTAASSWRFGIVHERGWLVATVVAALVGIGIDTSFTLGLATLILAYAIAEGEIFGRAAWWEPVAKHGRWALAIGVGVAVILDTRLLTSPGGIQVGLIDPLIRWTDEIARGAGLTAPLLIGLLDGSLVILALIGLIEYPRYPRAVRFLGTWLLVSLTLASLMRMPDPRYLSQPMLPAGLLAGFGLLALVSWIRQAGSSRTTVIALVGLVPVITTAFQINAGLRNNLSPWSASGVVLVAGLLLVALLAFNVLRGLELSAAFATWLLVLLAFGSISGAGRTLEARGDDRGQLADQSVATAEMRNIRETALTWYRAMPDGPLPVDPGLRPLVGWALRDIPTVRYSPEAASVAGPRLLSDPPVSVSPDTKTIRYIVGYSADWGSLTLQPGRLWRWALNRETLVTLRPYAIVVVQPAGS
ncbi:MAG: glycosyltransferase family 39 protein [Chloroflexota bacterium]